MMIAQDMVLYHGDFHTMDAERPRAQAVVVSQGRIAAVGDDSLADEWPGALRLDLEGKTVIPGLTDSHIHFVSHALAQQRVDLRDVSSPEDALRRVADRAAETETGRWVLGRGWDRNLWPGGRYPTRWDLDTVAPDNPVFLWSKDGHVAWVNSRALEEVCIGQDTPSPAGGEIIRDAHGRPTGILRENAAVMAEKSVPQPSASEIEEAILQMVPDFHAMGLVGIHDFEGRDAFLAFQHLLKEGRLGLRVNMGVPLESLDAALSVGLTTGFGDHWLRIGNVKIFSDGTLGSRTAAMLEPFEGEPDNRGMLDISPEDLRDAVRKAGSAGLAVAVHAIGDRANRLVLDVLEEARRRGDVMRHRIEHAQLLAEGDMPRFASLGVIASMQPIHATADMEIADLHWGERSKGAYAFRSLLDLGVHLAFGSDAPVESPNPFLGIHAAVTRQHADGTPAGGWHPEERISVEEAVRGYTMGAAYASGEESVRGSISPGKLADMVVLSQDIFSVSSEAIPDTQVLTMVVDGKIMFRR